MFRKLCMLIAMALTLCGALFAPNADAQGSPTCPGSLFLAPTLIEDPPPPTPEPTVVPTDDTAGDSDDTQAQAIAGVASAEVEFVSEGCADAIAYPGPFQNMPSVPASPYAAPRGITAPATADAPAAASPITSPDLAHSGSEVVVLVYLGTGLLAFGAVALGVRRGGFVE